MAAKFTDKKKDNNPTNTLIPASSEISYEQIKKEHKLYFNIVKKRYIWFAISLLILIPGIISLFMHGLNLGIDYTGGSLYDIKFNQAVTQTQVMKVMDSQKLTGQVQLSSDGKDVIIRTSALEEDQRDALLSALEKEVGTFDRAKLKEDLVGPSIGAELRSGAVKAITVAAILILIYVSVRFRLIYAVSALIALFHDIFVVLGVFSIFQWPVDAAFIAAILTVFGYSINDTVVIYDRIRENEKRLKKKDSFEDMVDKSVWQTMGRSIKTVSTVIIALLCIFILGGESTRMFALAMMVGVFSGAYSSIFTASQIVVEIRNRTGGNNKKKTPAEA